MIALLAACTAGPAPESHRTEVASTFPTFAPPAPAPVPEPQPTVPPPPPAPDPSFLFEDVAVTELAVEVSPAAWARLLRHPFEQVRGSLVHDGTVYAPIGVRLKGHGSFRPVDTKPSLKLEIDAFDPDLEFHGLEVLVLNNLANDPSSMHERLAHRMFREAGVPDVRSGHAQLRFNGVDYGLYALDEDVDDDFLKARWDHADGPLYELFDADFTAEGVAAFEHEEGPDDRAVLEQLAAVLETVEPGDWDAVVPYVDTIEVLRYWAVAAYVGQFDAYPYSFPGDDVHLYVDPLDGRMEMIPHGCDEAFTDPERPVDYLYGHLMRACLLDADCEQRFRDEVWRVVDLAEAIDLAGYAEEVRLSLLPHVLTDVRSSFTPAQRIDGAFRPGVFLAGRVAALEERLGPRPGP